jgi:PEP-CTERM motif
MKSTSWFVAALCCILAIAMGSAASAANIAWVSFHSADGTPTTAAGTAGFTQAPDVGYTTALTAAGHNVTRVVTQDITATVPMAPDKLATLNASDLIIISRSVASGHYQQPEETLFWNTFTKPIINTGAYTMRNSRLGMYTGGTIPDTVNPVRLTATNPSHPIFAGVALDGSNVMVNTYADPVTTPFAPNTLQRGISVVTEPIAAGGQLLATVPAGAVSGAAIALFPPGTMTATDNAVTRPANVLGGYRMLFLTGSREHDGLTSEGSGIYDLSADGGRMFLNAVNFMLAIPEPSTGMLLAFAVAGLGLLRKR